MKVVDELFTPGCPQCAVKHLSAALYHRAKMPDPTMMFPNPYMVCVCTAYINLVEVRAGYLSHLWYAVGALARAEELMAPRVGGCVAREARLMLEEHGVNALLDALNCIQEGIVPDHADWAAAHFGEAVRELPAFASEMRMDDLIGSIDRIREEFFNLPPSTVPGDDETTKTEKEPDMATAKKAAPKGAKCAAKGGKTGAKGAKCAEKGGKTAAKPCAKCAAKGKK
jgi:hypothetical protein